MNVNLHLLRFFVAVVEHGGFTRAAEALHVSQPAVSRGVRELEGQIGAPLLERVGREIALTIAGQRLIGHARALFASERAMAEEIAALKGLERGVLRIAASTTIAAYCLPDILGAYHARYPAVELHLTSANTQTVVQMLGDRAIDIAMVEGPVSEPGLISERWLADELVLIAPPAHPLANRLAPLTGADVAEATFILREHGSGTREVSLEALSRVEARPQHVLEISSGEAIVRMVAAGMGLAMVSRYVAANHLALGLVVPIRLEGLDARRFFQRLEIEGRQLSPAALAFNKALDQASVTSR